MLQLYREIERNEFFVVAVDCAQGGADRNFGQFISKSRADIPLVFKMRGVAADMTPLIHQALEWIFDKTGVQPVVAFERNMGGASEMSRLQKLNRQGKYRIYQKYRVGDANGETMTDSLGFDTNVQTRPQILGDLKQAIDNDLIRIYDKDTVDELCKFIINKRGKAEAAANCHDDAVMSLAIAWQLYQTENSTSANKMTVRHRTGIIDKIF